MWFTGELKGTLKIAVASNWRRVFELANSIAYDLTMYVCQGHGIRGTIVQEESARHGMRQNYSPIPADHFKICKPADKNAIAFQLLARFIRNILNQVRYFWRI